MTRVLAAIALIAAIFGLSVGRSAHAQETNPRFCLIPIKNGEPTAADHNDAWRMVGRVVMPPGISRPIIYAHNRGGVWTVDETDAFVRYGGDFPRNSIHDKFAIDPNTGLVAGVSSFRGLFYIRPGQTTFTKVVPDEDSAVTSLYSITFIDRWRRFVISDSSGLYLWNADRSITPLGPLEPEIKGPTSVFDLPSIEAVLVNAMDRDIIVLWDDGRAEPIAKRNDGDFVVAAEVGPKGIDVWTYRETLSFGRDSSGQFKTRWRVAGGRPIFKPFEPTEIPQTRRSVHNPATGRRIFYNAGGIFEELDTGDRAALEVPFDPRAEHVLGLMEMPASRATILFTANRAFALQHDGKIVEVAGSQYLADTRLSPQKGVIPVRNEMLVAGPRALYLLADTLVSGKSRCKGQQ